MKLYRVVYQYRPGLRWLGRGKGKVNDFIGEEGQILRVHWTAPMEKEEALRILEGFAAGMLFRVGLMKVSE